MPASESSRASLQSWAHGLLQAFNRVGCASGGAVHAGDRQPTKVQSSRPVTMRCCEAQGRSLDLSGLMQFAAHPSCCRAVTVTSLTQCNFLCNAANASLPKPGLHVGPVKRPCIPCALQVFVEENAIARCTNRLVLFCTDHFNTTFTVHPMSAQLAVTLSNLCGQLAVT